MSEIWAQPMEQCLRVCTGKNAPGDQTRTTIADQFSKVVSVTQGTTAQRDHLINGLDKGVFKLLTEDNWKLILKKHLSLSDWTVVATVCKRRQTDVTV